MAGTIKGSPTVTDGFTGKTGGTDESAGIVGECVRNYVPLGSSVGIPNAAYTQIAAISLTGGDWDVSAIVSFGGNATGITSHVILIGTAANTSTGIAQGDNCVESRLLPLTTTGYTEFSYGIHGFRWNTSASSTLYLNARAAYTGGTATGYGRLSARRMR